jgi:cyclic pyranopterin phosphate synthase
MLVDAFGRTIDYLRVSVTDRCNLRCEYCMPAEGMPRLAHADILTYEEIEAFVKVAVTEGVRHVRLTGGEPLARLGIVSLVQKLAAIPDLQDLSLTTNGIKLPEFGEALRDAGLRRVNIGFSSLDPDTYHTLTRGGDLAQALAGLETAIRCFSPVKVNVVVLRGVSDDPTPFLELTRRLPVEVRFIEYMPIGPKDSGTFYVPAQELEQRLEALGPFEEANPAEGKGPASRRRRIPGAPGSFALITPVSEHFCAACTRLRLTSDGHLRLCLLMRGELDVKSALRPEPDSEKIRELLQAAVAAKPAGILQGTDVRGRGMSQIGG